MKFHRLTATFGRLNNQSLELGPGLNILEAPNETGKSTWCAFILAMLYGIDSRQRDKAGFIAEKNRYAPWSGTAMSGRLDCSTDDTKLTLLRETKRSNAPMGHFSAQYTGTADAIPGITGQNCGEELLGVPRDVYERSAFIRQTGLGISANAELERRITSLITTGDEGTSYTEAYAALKKQLNRRKHNKTGEIPAAEAELAELRQQLESLQKQRLELQQFHQSLEELHRQRSVLLEQLAACRRYEELQTYSSLSAARSQAAAAQQHTETLRRHLEADRIPDMETIGRLQGTIAHLETTRQTLETARGEQEQAAEHLRQAEAAANSSPFAGMTAAQAEKLPLPLDPKSRLQLWQPALSVLSGCILGFAVFFATKNLPAAIGVGSIITGLAILVSGLLMGKKQNRWEDHAALLRSQRDAELEAYTRLYQAVTAAKAEADKKTAAADALRQALSSGEQGLLLEIRRFAPSVATVAAADAALQECITRHKNLAIADAEAQRLQLRCDTLEQQMPNIAPPAAEEPSQPAPALSRDQLEARLAALQDQLTVQTSAADRLSGQISAAGEPDVLTARMEELEETLSTLSGEYNSLELAMSVLDTANATLQNRFSPALGRRAAEIFHCLTDGRYTGVVLDRSFHMAAEPASDPVYRDAQLLSAGAADQLYLAVRLAICEMVLPEEHRPPIVLDDALSNYDDQRCAAALEWLREEAENRQILLFTCHSREAEFFRNDPKVRIQRLT